MRSRASSRRSSLQQKLSGIFFGDGGAAPPAATTTTDEPSDDRASETGGRPTESRAEKSWGRARSLKMMIATVDGKIPLENKVRFLPEGETKDVANQLHRGIGGALSGWRHVESACPCISI